MILLIDNYDSFSYNLVQLIGGILEEQKDKKRNQIKIIRNDELTIEELNSFLLSHIILSPGPKRPSEAGICEEVIRTYQGKVPILGVCLGHQAICEVFGAEITYAKTLMHGKQSIVNLDTTDTLFKNLPKQVLVARYHSLAVKKENISKELVVTATTEDGEIMAVRHRDLSIYGVQFHPESVLTPNGREMLTNFLNGSNIVYGKGSF